MDTVLFKKINLAELNDKERYLIMLAHNFHAVVYDKSKNAMNLQNGQFIRANSPLLGNIYKLEL